MSDPSTRATGSARSPSLGVEPQGKRSFGEAPQNGGAEGSFLLLVLGRIALGIVEVFFLCFGIYLLVLSYHLTDPLSFIMTFFASNLVILISAVLLLGLILKFRKRKETGIGTGFPSSRE